MFIRLRSIYRLTQYTRCQIWHDNRWRDVFGLFPGDFDQYLIDLVDGEPIIVPGRAWVWCEREKQS